VRPRPDAGHHPGRGIDRQHLGATGRRHEGGAAAAGADIDQAIARAQAEAVERAARERVGQRFEHRFVHRNVIVPSRRLLVWLEVGC